MNWDRWYCPNQACAVREWMVQCHPATRDIWWVAEHEHDRPITVAASDPVCPRCGLTLVGMVELERSLSSSLALPHLPCLGKPDQAAASTRRRNNSIP